mgnify:CR=1 FL=1
MSKKFLIMKKPYLIEFLGMPRAGKTTQIKLLKKYFESRGKKVHVISDRERAARMYTPPDEPIAYDLVIPALGLEAYFKHRDKVDVIIADRGFQDGRIWFDIKGRLGEIPLKRAKQLKDTFLEYENLADCTICMMVDPTTAVGRHQNTKHMKVDDLGLSLPYLNALVKSYKQHRRHFKNCLWINGNKTPQEMHNNILSFLK